MMTNLFKFLRDGRVENDSRKKAAQFSRNDAILALQPHQDIQHISLFYSYIKKKMFYWV